MKKNLKIIFIFIIFSLLIAGMAMLAGIIPIRASSGHFPITKWFLQFSMSRSVSTYSMNTKVPFLDDPDLIVRGASHFEVNCRQCHGGPEGPSLIGQSSMPPAEHLSPVIKRWSPKELFELVKHGVKFTGMPAWPTQKRDDEVWAVVAFLLILPTMTVQEYRKMVYVLDDPFVMLPPRFSGIVAHDLLVSCGNCHGLDGNGREMGQYPKLASQRKEYLMNSLHAYKEGKRHSGSMELVASKLDSEAIETLAQYFHEQPLKTKNVKAHNAIEISRIKRGELIAKKGIPEQKVAPCMGCHGPDPKGIKRKAHFPNLKGQPADYLQTQLELFLNNKRGGSEYIKLMRKAVPSLTKEQILDVSKYYESLNF